MSTSGTAVYNPGIPEIIEEAFERCGLVARSGYDIKTARRSLNIMALEWANKGLNLWTVESGTLDLVAGTAEYDLPADTVDVIEGSIRTMTGINQQDLAITRVSVSTYAQQVNKNIQSNPYQYFVRRLVDGPKVVFWPIPDDTQPYQFYYWRMRRIQDMGSTFGNTLDVPVRFVPAMIAGLAYYIAIKRAEAKDRIPMLKELYDEAFMLAADEDRDRSSNRFVPKMPWR